MPTLYYSSLLTGLGIAAVSFFNILLLLLLFRSGRLFFSPPSTSAVPAAISEFGQLAEGDAADDDTRVLCFNLKIKTMNNTKPRKKVFFSAARL